MEQVEKNADVLEYEKPLIFHPATMICSGSTSSGKSTFLHSLISDIDYVMTPRPKSIHYCYDTWQESFNELKTKHNVNFIKGFSPELLHLENFRDSLLCFDDTCDFIPDSNWLRLLYTRRSHHLAISCCILIHHLHTKALPFFREIALQTHITILLSSPRCLDSVEIFARQVFKREWQAFMDLYANQVENKRFSYLLLDHSPRQNSLFRIRNNIFSFEQPLTIYIPSRLIPSFHNEGPN